MEGFESVDGVCGVVLIDFFGVFLNFVLYKNG